MTEDLKEATELLLREASTQAPQPTADLLDAVEKSGTDIAREDVRYAYWHLVKEGRLERTPQGVRKAENVS